MNLRRKRPLVGLDIGTSSVKAAVLKPGRKGRGYTLQHLDAVPLPPEVIVDGAIMDSGPIVDAITRLGEASKVRSPEVAVALSGHSVIVKRVSIPSMSSEELAESIHWEAEQYIPFDIDDVNIDYQVLDQHEDGDQMDVLLVAVKKDKIQDYTSVISQAGRIPVVVDVDVFAVQNAYEINQGALPGEAVALVNVGAAVTNVAILTGGQSRFWRDLSVGGNLYTEAIQRELGVTYEEAEEAKRGRSGAEIDPGSLAPIMESITEDVVGEIQKTVDFFLASQTDQELSRMVLSGGTAQMEALPPMLAERLGCPVEHLDPFAALAIDSRSVSEEVLAELGSSAAVAIGLAIRKVDDR
ncbi:MAG: type IV pilus assembly protein PilM [Acidobacteriota bacterium]